MFRTILLPCFCAVPFASLPAVLLAQQTGACGQPTALTQVLPDALAPGFEEVSAIARPLRSEPGYLEFSVPAPVDLTLQTLGRGIDTVLTLYDARGAVVAWDDDSAGNLDARLGVSLEPGTYCAQVRPVSPAPMEDAMVVVLASPGLPPDPEAEEEAAVASVCADPELALLVPAPLSGGETGSASASLDPAEGARFWRITVAEPVRLRLDALGDGVDTVLSLRDDTGTLLFENDDHPEMQGTDSRIDESLAPGAYCVSVAPFGEAGGSFTLELAAAAPAGAEAAGDLQVPGAQDDTPVEELGVLETELESRTLDRARTLWTRFEAAGPGPVVVEGVSVTGDFALRLFGEDGALLQEAESGGAPASARMEANLPAGRYLVALTNDDDGDGLKMRQIRLRR